MMLAWRSGESARARTAQHHMLPTSFRINVKLLVAQRKLGGGMLPITQRNERAPSHLSTPVA